MNSISIEGTEMGRSIYRPCRRDRVRPASLILQRRIHIKERRKALNLSRSERIEHFG